MVGPSYVLSIKVRFSEVFSLTKHFIVFHIACQIMSSTLNPSPATMAAYKGTIVSTLKNDLPSDVLASAVAPILSCVNQWANQIPAMLEGTSPSPHANLIFAIRKELFQPPQFVNNIFGKPLSELPPPFQEFVNFIRDLQDAQKVERAGPVVVKVRSP